LLKKTKQTAEQSFQTEPKPATPRPACRWWSPLGIPPAPAGPLWVPFYDPAVAASRSAIHTLGENRDGSELNAFSRESRAATFAPVPVLRPEPATKNRQDETTQHFSHVFRERCIIDFNDFVFFTTRVFWAGSHRRNGACSDRSRVGRQPRRQGARCLRCNDTSRTDRNGVADHCHRLGL
jgi:hypothetical protein